MSEASAKRSPCPGTCSQARPTVLPFLSKALQSARPRLCDLLVKINTVSVTSGSSGCGRTTSTSVAASRTISGPMSASVVARSCAAMGVASSSPAQIQPR
jgi:hypothetical protein